ncbi:MAG: carbamoyltransferase HypF [Deltaproteobacteria bacterium]|nr:carbamoyltransferase HypF [Candidatus Zymogenaceae bacterium]
MTGVLTNSGDRIRVRSLFSGTVQGVGFRPFIYRNAVRFGLTGFVKNTSDGVVAELEGEPGSIDSFFWAVQKELPPLAEITGFIKETIPIVGTDYFLIIASDRTGQSSLHIPADIASCDRCVAELFDPGDRRYRYPFINCTDCGPRLTIIRDIPYDREKTSMATFALCPDCRKEYEDPQSRRFHAQPNACPRCGPQVELLAGDGEPVLTDDPVGEAARRLHSGMIVAIRGLGGFHLAVDATDDRAVSRLRDRKLREEKPFALMVRDIRQARRIVEVTDEDQDLLLSARRPIVLMSRKEQTNIARSVAPGMGTFGIMLPYTPLQHLLFDEDMPPLVMTSGNRSGEPIAIGNDDAIERLSGIADFFLVHNREIVVRCDDSITAVVGGHPIILRRSRGYVPGPIVLSETYPEVLGVGGHLKATLCTLKGNMAFMSPYIGDMDTPGARGFFFETVALMERITECVPRIVACDLHPGYFTTDAARRMKGMRLHAVQHHHAHIVSCMAENGVSGNVIGVALDGTGYGNDGTIWGGEFLVADRVGFVRAGHLASFTLPGGEAAVREPRRTAASLIKSAYGQQWRGVVEKLGLVPEYGVKEAFMSMVERGINSPVTTSMGRVFDGVAAILGLRGSVNFEGQAAMELEACAVGGRGNVLPFEITQKGRTVILDLNGTIRGIVEGMGAGMSPGDLAAAFHATLVGAIGQMVGEIRDKTKINRAALSGGCFQNRILLTGVLDLLEAMGFEVLIHHRVPTNDGGIALGQAVTAGSRENAGIN